MRVHSLKMPGQFSKEQTALSAKDQFNRAELSETPSYSENSGLFTYRGYGKWPPYIMLNRAHYNVLMAPELLSHGMFRSPRSQHKAYLSSRVALPVQHTLHYCLGHPANSNRISFSNNIPTFSQLSVKPPHQRSNGKKDERRRQKKKHQRNRTAANYRHFKPKCTAFYAIHCVTVASVAASVRNSVLFVGAVFFFCCQILISQPNPNLKYHDTPGRLCLDWRFEGSFNLNFDLCKNIL